jgi:hypothetical protein
MSATFSSPWELERLRAQIAECLLTEGGGDLVAVELLEVVGEHH